MKISGIYTITNLINGKIIVGSTEDLNKRNKDHFSQLKRGTHKNPHLQYSFNKHGENNFKFEVLEECNIEYLISTELFWVNMLDTQNKERGYNIITPALGWKGGKHTEESKKKIGLASKGNKYACGTKGRTNLRPVVQYDKQGNIIREYPFLNNVKEYGFSKSAVCRVCKGTYSEYKNFIWKYKDK